MTHSKEELDRIKREGPPEEYQDRLLALTRAKLFMASVEDKPEGPFGPDGYWSRERTDAEVERLKALVDDIDGDRAAEIEKRYRARRLAEKMTVEYSGDLGPVN